MGNNICCVSGYTHDLSYIDSLGSFIKCLLENLTRVQGEISNCSPNQRNEKANYNEDIIPNIATKNYARFQYYIYFNNILVKLKILSEDYFFIKKGYQLTDKELDKEKKETPTLGMGTIDLTHQDFDLEKAKIYLGKILDTEDSVDIKKLEALNNEMIQSLYSNNE